jgi:hypothetical protein
LFASGSAYLPGSEHASLIRFGVRRWLPQVGGLGIEANSVDV